MITYLDVTYTRKLVTLAPCPVPAGFPSPADVEEVVDFVSWIVRHETSTFWCKVSGDSLHDMGIQDGDWIAVDRTGKACPGRVVSTVQQFSPALEIYSIDESFLDMSGVGDPCPSTSLNGALAIRWLYRHRIAEAGFHGSPLAACERA